MRTHVIFHGTMSDHDETTPAPSPAPETPTESPEARAAGDELLEQQVRLALRKVKDPELNLNVVDLGLIYGVRAESGAVDIDMTLTSPGCPSGPQIMGDVERVTKAVEGVTGVAVNLVWAPYWTPERIEPRVRAYMGL